MEKVLFKTIVARKQRMLIISKFLTIGGRMEKRPRE